jgi:hypothetical protein
LHGVAEDGAGTVDELAAGTVGVMDPEAVVEGVTDAVDEAAGEQRGEDIDGVNADGLGVGEERALGAEGVEVGKSEVGGAVLEELVVGELVEDDPDQEGMLARGLGGGGGLVPCGGDLVGRGLPCGDPEELRDAGEGKEGEGGGDKTAGAQEAAIPLVEAQEEQKNDGGPEDEEERDQAFDEIERIDGLGALQEIGREDDGEQQTQPGVEAGARECGEEEEEEEGQDEEVGDMRIADLGEGERGVHADVRAASEQVAVVGYEDEGGEAERLAELLQHSSILSEGIFSGSILSKRRRMRPFARG